MLAIKTQTDHPTEPEITLTGSCGYTLLNNRIIINVNEIANQRDVENISGTLSLELWALKQPYTGGEFNGVALAGTAIGEVSGQHFINPLSLELDFQEPPEGIWYLALMLREWNGAAYETRDYVNFAVPYTVESRATIARSGTNNIINVSFTESKKVFVTDAETGKQVINEASIESQTTKLAATEISLNGNCGYVTQEGKITINVGEIANQRDYGTISGTLSVELWAMKTPYAGGDFNGIPLAGTTIGELYGQHFINLMDLSLDFQEPPEGIWQLALMVREWNGVAYETRDFINFALPYIVESKPAVARKEADNNVINFRASETKKPATSEPEIKKAVATEVEAKKPVPTETEAKKPVAKEETKPVANELKPKAEAATKPAAVDEANVKAKAPEASTSINQVHLKELASIKGVSKKTAENIVASRPFGSFDDLSKVKGVGPKLLNTLRKIFTL